MTSLIETSPWSDMLLETAASVLGQSLLSAQHTALELGSEPDSTGADMSDP